MDFLYTVNYSLLLLSTMGFGRVTALRTPVVFLGSLKVHKHEIFFLLFLQKPKPYGPKGL
jgi:hypothetical protein